MRIDSSYQDISFLTQNNIHQNKTENAAREFEEMFTQMMLKEMRPKDVSGGITGAGKAEESFHQFYDEALASNMLDTGFSFGFRDQIIKEIQ